MRRTLQAAVVMLGVFHALAQLANLVPSGGTPGRAGSADPLHTYVHSTLGDGFGHA